MLFLWRHNYIKHQPQAALTNLYYTRPLAVGENEKIWLTERFRAGTMYVDNSGLVLVVDVVVTSQK